MDSVAVGFLLLKQDSWLIPFIPPDKLLVPLFPFGISGIGFLPIECACYGIEVAKTVDIVNCLLVVKYIAIVDFVNVFTKPRLRLDILIDLFCCFLHCCRLFFSVSSIGSIYPMLYVPLLR